MPAASPVVGEVAVPAEVVRDAVMVCPVVTRLTWELAAPGMPEAMAAASAESCADVRGVDPVMGTCKYAESVAVTGGKICKYAAFSPSYAPGHGLVSFVWRLMGGGAGNGPALWTMNEKAVSPVASSDAAYGVTSKRM